MNTLKSFKPAYRLKENVDYTNVSYMVDTGYEFVPFYEYTNIPHTDFIKINYNILEGHLKQTGNPYRALYPVINEFSINNYLFKIQEHPVHVSNAFSAGLGVIKIRNDYYLYDYFCESWMSDKQQHYYRNLKKDLYMLLTFNEHSELVKLFYHSNDFETSLPYLSLDRHLDNKIGQVLSTSSNITTLN